MRRGKLSNSTFRRMDSLQELVERKAPVNGDDDLAIEHKPAGRQTSQRFDQFRKITLQRLPRLGLQSNALAVAKRQTTEAVPFGLVEPSVAVWDFVDRKRFHR